MAYKVISGISAPIKVKFGESDRWSDAKNLADETIASGKADSVDVWDGKGQLVYHKPRLLRRAH